MPHFNHPKLFTSNGCKKTYIQFCEICLGPPKSTLLGNIYKANGNGNLTKLDYMNKSYHMDL